MRERAVQGDAGRELTHWRGDGPYGLPELLWIGDLMDRGDVHLWSLLK
jgi:hypothetical protein